MVTETTKPTVVLIYGRPNSGKSYLADQLHTEYGFHVLNSDWVYVDFIHLRYSEVYFPLIKKFVKLHHDGILLSCIKRNLLPDAEELWRAHLCAVTEESLRLYSRLAVEGYLVESALPHFESSLKDTATVRIVKVDGRKYLIDDREVTVAEIAG